PPSLHFDQPNPLIPFEALRLRVNTEVEPWPSADPPVAGVSAFGWSGTNCHVLLGGLDAAPAHLLVLGAADEAGRRGYAAAVAEVAIHGSRSIADVCAEPRGDGPCRLAVVARTRRELSERLGTWLDGRTAHGCHIARARGGRRRTAFVFSPQGGQWRGMA